MKNLMGCSLCLMATLAAVIASPPVTAAEYEKPNVVLMLADNLGFGDVSAYNLGIRGGFRTPRIDQLAGEGMQLTQFLVEPGCTPSRAGLQTGRYSVRLGLSLIIAPGGVNTLQDEEITLGELFRSAGYSTTYVGKWHLDAGSHSQPQNQGYDQWLSGFTGSTDAVLYGQQMEQFNAPQRLRESIVYSVMEAKGPGEAKRIRPYDLEYRKQIEADMADAAVNYIKNQARSETPFFLMIGWSRPHFPNDTSVEFAGRSGAGKYGDSVVELDYRTGQVLDAIKEAGIEDDTIVIFVSDNGATLTAVRNDELFGGDNGPFRGELGDGYEGSIRTVGMIRWPGKIKPGVSNEMFALHDIFPTLASIIGARVPQDRPIDGVDQSDFLLGKQQKSNREHLLTFVGDRIIAVRWRQWRLYPVEMGSANSNPATAGMLGTTIETAGYPEVYNIEADPKEKVNVVIQNGWLVVPYLQIINEYLASLVEYPNSPAPTLTDFRRATR
jgi:arylsulfatase